MSRKKLLVLLLTLGFASFASAGESLNSNQMGDLIVHGQMNGADGARYDVWIVPGYAGPLDNAAAGWRSAGHDLAEYGHAALYESIGDTSKGMLKFAGKEAIVNFALKGSADAWVDAFTTAQGRVERQVFGWWFAYPWAVIEATGESALRIIIGVPGGVIIGGLGVSVVPAVQFIWPAGKGVYHSVFKGTALPIAAATWNTLIAPPMALAGSQPTVARADGFWMKRLTLAEKAQVDAELIRVNEALKQWRKGLVTSPEAQAISAEEATLRKTYEAQRSELGKAFSRDEKQLEEKRIAVILQKAQQPDSFASEDKAQLAVILQRYGKNQVLQVLRGDGINQTQAEALLATLVEPQKIESAPEGNTPPADTLPEKTDPLKRSLEKVLN